MLVNDAIGKHLVAPGVLYVIHKYVYIKKSSMYPSTRVPEMLFITEDGVKFADF